MNKKIFDVKHEDITFCTILGLCMILGFQKIVKKKNDKEKKVQRNVCCQLLEVSLV